MQDFYNSFTFIIAFAILTLVIQMSLGRKVTEGFLALVLCSMLVANADVFQRMAQNLREVKT